MAEAVEACRLQDHLERLANRGDECDQDTDGRSATLVDALGVLPSRCAALSDVTPCHTPLHRGQPCDPSRTMQPHQSGEDFPHAVKGAQSAPCA